MKTAIKISFITILALALIFLLNIAYESGYRNVDELEKVALTFLPEEGYKIEASFGYNWNMIRGGNVWFQVSDDNGYQY